LGRRFLWESLLFSLPFLGKKWKWGRECIIMKGGSKRRKDQREET